MKKTSKPTVLFIFALASALVLTMVGIALAGALEDGQYAKDSKKETGINELYSTLFMIKEINAEERIATVINCNGTAYKYDKIDGWKVGDYMTAVMDDNGTEDIFDDFIVSVRDVNPKLFKLYEIWYGINQ